MSAIENPAAGAMPVPTETRRVVLPAADVFARRAARFEQLAAQHGMGDWLRLMAALSRAQHDVLPRRDAPGVDALALQHSREHAMPPLSTLRHARPASWRDDLAELATQLQGVPLAAPMLAAAAALDDDAREALADRVVNGDTLDTDAAAAPLVGAALQLAFTRIAASLDVRDVEGFTTPSVCPVCATRPLASIVYAGGDRDKRRYLVCALCATEWNLARIQCSSCQGEKSVHYLSLTPVPREQAGDAGAAAATASADADDEAAAQAGAEQARRAEACDECGSYLKIFYRDKDPHADPAADDLASLALDIAVQERGYGRSGPNLLLHPGESG